MNTLVVHQADMATLLSYCDWLGTVPDQDHVHELSLFYGQKPDDIAYIRKQVRLAVSFYQVRKIIFFNIGRDCTCKICEIISGEFPELMIEFQERMLIPQLA